MLYPGFHLSSRVTWSWVDYLCMPAVFQNTECTTCSTPLPMDMALWPLEESPCRFCHFWRETLPYPGRRVLQMAWGGRTYEKHWCSSYYQCPFQPLHPIWIPRASCQRQWTPLSIKRIWGLPEAQWHTARISVTIPSRRQWPGGTFRSNIQEISASIRRRWNFTTAYPKLSSLLS